MVKYVIARQLMGKKVLSLNGYDLGKFIDAEVDSVTGRINTLVLEPDVTSSLAKKLSPDGNELRVPRSAISSVADYIIIDTRSL